MWSTSLGPEHWSTGTAAAHIARQRAEGLGPRTEDLDPIYGWLVYCS